MVLGIALLSILPLLLAPVFFLLLKILGHSEAKISDGFRVSSFTLGVIFLIAMCIGIWADLDDARIAKENEQSVEQGATPNP